MKREDRRSEPPVLALALVVVILAALGSSDAVSREARLGAPVPLVVSLLRGDRFAESFAAGGETDGPEPIHGCVHRADVLASRLRPHAMPLARAPTPGRMR